MKRFKELVRETAVEPDTPSQAAMTYKEKPNKEPMQKLKQEEVEQIDELSNELLGRYKDKAVVSHGEAEKAKNYKLSDKRFSGVVKATNKQFDNFRKKPFKLGEEKDEPPFDPDPPKKKQVIPGKHGAGYSTARHLARQALKKQTEKLKPVKESLDESRKTEIVKEIVKKKKNDKSNTDTFQKEPVLSSEIVKA